MATATQYDLFIPSLTVLIPTRGGGDLDLTLHSISTQATKSDYVIVIGDGPQPSIRASLEALNDSGVFPCHIQFLESERTNDFGHTQLNEAQLLNPKTSHLLIQDDDDIFLPRAFNSIREKVSTAPDDAHIFRFYTNDHLLVWDDRDNHAIEETMIGSHNLVVPWDHQRLGRFTPRYRGDFDWTKSTLEFYPEHKRHWHRSILTRQRPNSPLLDWDFPTYTDNTRKAKPAWAYFYTEKLLKHSPPPVGEACVYLTTDGPRFEFGLSPDYTGKGYLRWIARHIIESCQGSSYCITSDPVQISVLESLGLTNVGDDKWAYQWP